MDYSLFMTVTAVIVLMEVEEQHRPTPAAFPLSIFAGPLCSVFFSVSDNPFSNPRIAP
jgi:hypothetical protein